MNTTLQVDYTLFYRQQIKCTCVYFIQVHINQYGIDQLLNAASFSVFNLNIFRIRFFNQVSV